jgi:hypothetical protein
MLFKDNIKVHFAACENKETFEAVRAAGGKYTLYTAYSFIKSAINKEQIKQCPDIQHVIKNSKRCIQDSGIFSLMYGCQKGKKDEKLLDKWCDYLIDFTLQNAAGAICVEIDCQKILSVEKAWEYRYRMREALPNPIINVFHLEDGQKGLDRLIEYSDYIAIGNSELKNERPETYKEDIYKLACYIKNKKPGIDIHLLGCTNLEILKKTKFCTSCDSTTFICKGRRFGTIGKYHVSDIINVKIEELEEYNDSFKNQKPVFLAVHHCLNEYRRIGLDVN